MKLDDPLAEFDGVTIYLSPWVRGTSADAYQGSVELSRLIKRGDESAIDWLMCRMAREVKERGGNSLVSFECSVNPFHSDWLWRVDMKGTSASLIETWKRQKRAMGGVR